MHVTHVTLQSPIARMPNFLFFFKNSNLYLTQTLLVIFLVFSE